MLEKLVKWFFFSVIVALLPLAFAWTHPFMTGQAKPVAEIIGRGELFIVAAALCAAAIGDLIDKSHSRRVNKILAYIAGGAAVVVLMLCSLFYVSASAGGENQPVVVATVSSAFYMVSVLTGAGSIALGEL